ncbi:ligase-associated DNA damage response DEXH box helicase [Brevundimonas sp. 2R-24]|uniref:Ligase-associated DNA damage response DEXH box helicase n=1 Tax=Peiella sedimenti TaxID=3061083 RepID=A0ABT8SJU2_9CAUL|nr:ligase-associated DNA damage response DEXH box helicase [Caulobacteraceae bacterium XZ-24]
MSGLPPPFSDWFAARGWAPRRHQLEMIAAAQGGEHALLIAPTGGGKTLAGFLPSLIGLSRTPADQRPQGVHTLYLSPLKALSVDVARNLTTPAFEMGLDVRIETRTGDTGQAKRQRQKVLPPEILLTTPEQLALFCAWEGARAWFQALDTVVIDEVHALWHGKRGDLLALGLARLQAFRPNLRRVGLSATVDDPGKIAAWLSPGGAPVRRIQGDPGTPAQIDILMSGGRVPWAGHTAEHAMEEVYEAIRRSRLTLVFVNTRWQAEFAFQRLWALNEDDLPIALHHGSLAAEQRRKVEAAMARGALRAVVCTSTLDLGIDWGDVDLVIQLAAPKGASRLTQRIGRANHRLDEPSRALLVPANRFEMLECQAAREAALEGSYDQEPMRTGTLDTLAQHIMGVACGEPFEMEALHREVTSAEPYRDLSYEQFEEVADLVATGGYALRTYDRFARIVKGRDGRWKARNAMIAQRHRMNVGAIVGAGTLNIRQAIGRKGRLSGGRKVGEAEEWYFEQLSEGDTFIFAGQVWRFLGISGTDVFVTPAPHSEPKIPSWGGSKFPLATSLAERVRGMIQDREHWAVLPEDVREWLELQERKSHIPDAEEMLVETFPRGSRWFLMAYPFEGRLAHTTLAMLLTRRLDRMGVGPLGFVVSDYGLSIWTVEPTDSLDLDELFDQDMLGDDLDAWMDESFLMKRAFRNCALVSGLIERRVPGGEKTGRQVTFSTDLIYDVLRRHQPDHLLLRCARADAAGGMLDVGRLSDMLARIRGRIAHTRLERPSAFSVPLLTQIGRERVGGSAQDLILERQAEAILIAEAEA